MQNQRNSPSPWAMGLTGFAGFLMILGGVFHSFLGLAAIINQNFFVVGSEYLYRFDVTTWGWIHLILGLIIAFAGISLLSGQMWARVIGIILAFMSAVANFFYIPYYPIWSILIIALDIGIIWALVTRDSEEAIP